MITPLMDAGRMPHTRKLVETGTMGNLRTLSPVLSPMLWTSIATGKRPYKHGIHGFSEPTPDGKAVQPVTNLSRNTKAIWNILHQNGKRSLVVGWWPSHPAEPISGVMVSNHYQRAPSTVDRRWPMQEGTVHPPELAEELKDLRVHPQDLAVEHYRPFVPDLEGVDQDVDRRLDSLARIIADATTIQHASLHLLETQEWDFAAVYFDAIDHFGHGYMKYHPPQQPKVSDKDFHLYQNVVTMGYLYHDMMLGHLLNAAGDDTTVILISDHGFHPDHLSPQSIPVEPAGPAAEHRDFGIVVINGPGIRRDHLIHGASLLDITPTILSLFHLSVGEDMDGKALRDAFESPVDSETIPSQDDVPGDAGTHPEGLHQEPNQSREQLEQLVALGYIDPPSDNMDEQIAKTQQELDYNLALAYMDGGLHGKAVPILSRLFRGQPWIFRFGIRLSMCLYTLGRGKDLENVLSALRENWAPASQLASERIAALRKERRTEDENEDENDAQGLLRDAREAYVFRQWMDIAKGNPRALDYIEGLLALAGDDKERAVNLLAQAKNESSPSPDFLVQIGHAKFVLDQDSDALKDFEAAIHLDPENPGAFVGLCRIHLKNKDYEKAHEAARRAIGLKYHFPMGHYFLACALEGLGEKRAALDAAALALEQNPNFPEAHELIARIHATDKEGAKADLHRTYAAKLRTAHDAGHSDEDTLTFPRLSTEEIERALPGWPEKPASTMLPPLALAERVETPDENSDPLIIVSGMPRSGTSLLMQMLHAANLTICCDDTREPDANNPKGYFEYEAVKSLGKDNRWLQAQSGTVLKVVAPMLSFVPQKLAKKVVFVWRDPQEIAASQQRMLDRLEKAGANLSSEEIVQQTAILQEQALRCLTFHEVPFLLLKHRELIEDPPEGAKKIALFLGLDPELESKMAHVVDPTLYRERNT